MKRLLKRIFVVLLLCFLLISVISASLVYLYGDEMKNALVDELNENFITEVKVGAIKVPFWSIYKTFPNISVTISDIRITDSREKEDGYSIQADYAYFSFDIWELIMGRYEVERVEINNGILNFIIDADGHANYIFWKTADKTDEEEKSTEFQLNLNQLVVSNTTFSFHDYTQKLKLDSYVERLNLSGAFTQSEFELDVKLASLIHELNIDEIKYVDNKKLGTESKLHVSGNHYDILRGKITVDNADFDLSGHLKTLEEGTESELQLKAEKGSIQSIIALIPETYKKHLLGFDSDGDIYFVTNISGLYGTNSVPRLSSEISISNAKLYKGRRNLIMDDLTFKAKIHNGADRSLRTSMLLIEELNAGIDGRSIKGSLKLENFSDPRLSFTIESDAHLQSLSKFINLHNVKHMEGSMYLNAKFDGRIADLEELRTASNVNLSGNLLLKNALFEHKTHELVYRKLNGTFRFDGNDLVIRDFDGEVSSSDFYLNGYIRNISSFLFFPERKLMVNATLESDYINLNELMYKDQETVSDDSAYTFIVPDYLLFDIAVKAGKLGFKRFNASNIEGRVSYVGEVLYLTALDFNAMDGEFKLNGSVDGTSKDNFKVEVKANCRNINITSLFYQCHDFGQSFIRSEHLKGRLNGDIELSMDWNNALAADLESIKAVGELELTQGQLNNFEPLVDMSGFAKIRKMDNLRFAKMKNRIHIDNQTVYIPSMDIESSELSLTLYGEHTFDNDIGYYVRMSLTELMFGKREDYETEFGVVERTNDDGMNLFIVMSGKGDEPKFSLDRQSVRAKIADKSTEEESLIKEIMREEFDSPDKESNDREASKIDDETLKWMGEIKEDYESEKGSSGRSQTDERRRGSFDNLRERLRGTNGD